MENYVSHSSFWHDFNVSSLNEATSTFCAARRCPGNHMVHWDAARTHHPFHTGQLSESNIHLSTNHRKPMVERKPVPVFTSPTDVFGSTQRGGNDLAVELERTFGRKPAYIAKARRVE